MKPDPHPQPNDAGHLELFPTWPCLPYPCIRSEQSPCKGQSCAGRLGAIATTAMEQSPVLENTVPSWSLDGLLVQMSSSVEPGLHPQAKDDGPFGICSRWCWFHVFDEEDSRFCAQAGLPATAGSPAYAGCVNVILWPFLA